MQRGADTQCYAIYCLHDRTVGRLYCERKMNRSFVRGVLFGVIKGLIVIEGGITTSRYDVF
jgi:hypothetical protein